VSIAVWTVATEASYGIALSGLPGEAPEGDRERRSRGGGGVGDQLHLVEGGGAQEALVRRGHLGQVKLPGGSNRGSDGRQDLVGLEQDDLVALAPPPSSPMTKGPAMAFRPGSCSG